MVTLKYPLSTLAGITRGTGDRGAVFAVTDVHIKYKASARYDDLLDVETSLS